MKIIAVRWTSSVNVLMLQCKCGTEFEHRADKWWAVCPDCHSRDNLTDIRDIKEKQDDDG